MSRVIHHLTPTFRPHDALGTHVRSLHNLLEENGCQSFIWSADKGEATPARAIKHFSASENGQDILIYQLAIGSHLADFALKRKELLIVNYHNITPPHYVDKWSPEMAQQLRWGRKQLTELAERADLAIAVSEYNASELREAGFKNVCVIPVLLEKKVATGNPRDADIEADGTRWLFVGRMVPNKSHHDLLVTLDAYRKLYDPQATLTLLGSSLPGYEEAIRLLIQQLDLQEAVEIKKDLSESEKKSEFQKADVYVSLSEHEGFGVPLLEAMSWGVPVVALDRAAVGETVGQGGLLLNDKQPTKVAAAINEVMNNQNTRETLIKSGYRRSLDFSQKLIAGRYLETLNPLIKA